MRGCNCPGTLDRLGQRFHERILEWMAVLPSQRPRSVIVNEYCDQCGAQWTMHLFRTRATTAALPRAVND